MSPTSYQTAPPRNKTQKIFEIVKRFNPELGILDDGKERHETYV